MYACMTLILESGRLLLAYRGLASLLLTRVTAIFGFLVESSSFWISGSHTKYGSLYNLALVGTFVVQLFDNGIKYIDDAGTSSIESKAERCLPLAPTEQMELAAVESPSRADCSDYGVVNDKLSPGESPSHPGFWDGWWITRESSPLNWHPLIVNALRSLLWMKERPYMLTETWQTQHGRRTPTYILFAFTRQALL